MELTPRLGLPLLVAGQVQKEIFHNEALALIDLLLAASVEDTPMLAPPASPIVGRFYRVAIGASGDFAGHDDALAGWSDGGWRFVTPVEGMRLVERSSGVELAFQEGAWTSGSTRVNELLVNGVKVVGPQLTAIPNAVGGSVVDTEVRAVVGQILTALRGHGLVAT